MLNSALTRFLMERSLNYLLRRRQVQIKSVGKTPYLMSNEVPHEWSSPFCHPNSKESRCDQILSQSQTQQFMPKGLYQINPYLITQQRLQSFTMLSKLFAKFQQASYWSLTKYLSQVRNFLMSRSNLERGPCSRGRSCHEAHCSTAELSGL